MLLHGSFNAIERVIFQRSCALFLRCRFVPIAVVARRNADKTANKEVKRMEQRDKDKSVLESLYGRQTKKAETVKEKATNAYLYAAYIVSLVVMGGMAYLLYEELLAPSSPQTVFSKAMSLVRKDPECHRLLGDSITGSPGSGDGRRRFVQFASHAYKKDGRDRIRVMFNVKGSRSEGVTTAEMEKVDGTWQWRFLIVSSTDLVPVNVVVIDNR